MKLKKNDLQELKKSGVEAIDKRLAELQLELKKMTLEFKRGKIANLRSKKMLRRSIAQLKTIKNLLKTN